MIGLSLLAFVLVLIGYTLAPQRDEGAAAHIFQLSIAALVPVGIVFLTTADWKERRRSTQPLAITATLVTLAFVGLYCLEHYWYLRH